MRLLTVGAALFVLTGGLSAQVVQSGMTPPVSIVPSLAIGLVGTGGAQATVGGTLFTSVTPASTTDLLEDTLQSYTLPANTLAVNGRGVRITVWGTYAADANTKLPRLYFGATVLASNSTTQSGGSWRITGTVIRTGAATELGEGDYFQSSGAFVTVISAPTETLSGAVLIKVTGTTATAIGDLTAVSLLVEAI